MEYVIGIDSGGTHYRVRACGLDGRTLGDYTGNTANHYALDGQTVRDRIEHHMTCCLEKFGGVRSECRAIVCGTTGLDSEEDALLLHKIYSELKGFSCPIECMNDAELAHYAVTGGYGVLVISGTGSIAFGCNHQGRKARVGGWSISIMGEEGSGSWVSRYALRHLARNFDCVVPDSPLSILLRENLNVTTSKQLADLSAELVSDYERQPELGGLVDRAAAQGDPWAIKILHDAAKETLNLVTELVNVLKMENDADLVVGVWGSNIVESPTHHQEFRRLLCERYPQARMCMPQMTALEGAVRLALEHLEKTY